MRASCCTASTLQKVVVVSGALALCHLLLSLVRTSTWAPRLTTWGFTTSFGQAREDSERTGGVFPAPGAVLDSQPGWELRPGVETDYRSETNRGGATKMATETENLKDIQTGSSSSKQADLAHERKVEEAIVSHVRRVEEVCGQLCNLTKPIRQAPFMGSVTSEVICKNLFSSDFLDLPSTIPPRAWKHIPKELQALYSYGGRVKISEYFLDNAQDGGGRKKATVFTKKHLEDRVAAWRAGGQHETYKGGSKLVDVAAGQVDVANKTVLVIGTQNPWLEAVLLARNPKQIITVEYGTFVSLHPTWEIILPEVFRSRYMSGLLPQFDLVFSYSSVEHSGLGRYGDALNPFGDIITIARAWCVSGPKAKLALAVPTCIQRKGELQGVDLVQFNAHRIYGPVQYPYLVTNWRFLWPTEPQQRQSVGTLVYNQPVFIFEKIV